MQHRKPGFLEKPGFFRSSEEQARSEVFRGESANIIIVMADLLSWPSREPSFMSAVVAAPVKWVESVSALRLPQKADRRLQKLMDRHNEGQLSAQEREELESLVDLSEKLSLVRGEALRLLGQAPQ